MQNEDNKKDKSVNQIILFFLTPIIIFLMMVNAAYPAMLTWNLWLPEYFGLPELSLPFAVLLYLTVALFRGGYTSRVEDNRTQSTKNNDLIIVFASPWVVYFIALITYKFFIL